jgi:uncharacterized protein YndB with AHSA1/START domain
MPVYSAARELLASRDDVWAFLAEPNHLSDWWPGINGVESDRRGLAPGARWRIYGLGRPTYVVGRKPDVAGTLIFLDVRPPEFASWQFVQASIDAEMQLAEAAPNRTRAQLTVSAPFLAGLRRSLPHKALTRLYALCQTAAEA